MFVDGSQPAGRVRIGAFGTEALSGQGTLIYLRFNVIAGAANSAMNFEQFIFGEGRAEDAAAVTTNGSFIRLGSTASGANVSGQIRSPNGRGISATQVILTDADGAIRQAQTNSFGYYRFDDIPAGETYIISVRHKRYVFVPQVINVGENIGELIIVAQP